MTVKPARLAFALILASVLPALAGEPGRYSLSPAGEGFLRLDTETGAVSLCSPGSDGWACESLPEATSPSGAANDHVDRSGLELDELRDRLAKAEADLAAAKTQNGSSPLGSKPPSRQRRRRRKADRRHRRSAFPRLLLCLLGGFEPSGELLVLRLRRGEVGLGLGEPVAQLIQFQAGAIDMIIRCAGRRRRLGQALARPAVGSRAAQRHGAGLGIEAQEALACRA